MFIINVHEIFKDLTNLHENLCIVLIISLKMFKNNKDIYYNLLNDIFASRLIN